MNRLPAHLTGLVLDLALLGALSMLAGVGFASVLVGWTFLWAPLVAVLVAGGLTLFAAWRSLLVGEAVALSLALFLLVGVVAIGGGPTPSAATTFIDAIVGGWAELLTSFAPADVSPTFLALPFTLAWFSMLAGGEMLRASRLPALPALGPLVFLGVSVLFSIEDRTIATIQGVGAVLLVLVLGLVQQRQQRTTESDLTTGASARWRGRGLVLAATLVVVSVGLAPFVGPRLPGADANPRFDLRERLEPPFNPLRLPSPLTSVKGELEGDRAEEVVMRITTDRAVRRWPVAVMGAYDGRVWTVAESAESRAGQYRPVDTFFPRPTRNQVDPDLEPVTAMVQAVDLGMNWLPGPGWPVRIDAGDLDVRYNAETGNTVLTGPVRDGTTWTVTGIPRPVLDDDDLAAAGIATQDAAEDLQAVPPVLRSLTGDLVEGLEPGWTQMAAIRDRLLDDGYYDISEDTPPGHSFFHLSQFLEDPDRIVGFEEQYAATAAILGRLAGVEVRVVVGFDLPEDRFESMPVDVLAGDFTAWVEVRADGLGWVPLEVTPTDESVPEEAQAAQAVEDVAIPNPPPPPPPPPEVERPEQPEVDETEEEEPDEDDQPEAASNLPLVAAAVGVGTPVSLFLLFALVVVGLKASRTRRRRGADDASERVAGAWEEFRDRCDERGLQSAPTSSPAEVAVAVAERHPATRASLRDLAAAVDRGAFHPSPPDDEGADRAWSLTDTAGRELDVGRSTWARWRARLNPAPLRRRSGR